MRVVVLNFLSEAYPCYEDNTVMLVVASRFVNIYLEY